MQPTQKAPQVENTLEKLVGRSTAIKGNVCVRKPIGCGQPIAGFRDELSVREYRISGLCQKCQDALFGP